MCQTQWFVLVQSMCGACVCVCMCVCACVGRTVVCAVGPQVFWLADVAAEKDPVADDNPVRLQRGAPTHQH